MSVKLVMSNSVGKFMAFTIIFFGTVHNSWEKAPALGFSQRERK